MRRLKSLSAVLCLFALSVASGPALGSSEPYLGEMLWVPYNFAPAGWAFCNGQLLSIQAYSALFSLLGTQYGGNGTTNFALPDLRGRVMIEASDWHGPYHPLGETGGETSHTLTMSEMPAHSHTIAASTQTATVSIPAGNGSTVYAQPAQGMLYGNNPTATLAMPTVNMVGNGKPHNNMMPYGTLNCIIAIEGIYPPRD